MPAVQETRPSGAELAARAWHSLRQAFAAMPALYIGAFILYGLTTAGLDTISAYPSLVMALYRSPRIFYFAFLVFVSALSFAALAAAAVATHRFILLDDTHPNMGWNSLHFFLWLVFLGLILFLLDTVKLLDRTAMPDSGLTVMVGGAIWIAKLVIAIHFALLFPSVALGEKDEGWRDRIATSWTRMKGNFWLFLSGDVVALFPFLIALVLSAVVVMAFSMLGTQHAQNGMAIFQILLDLVGFPILMVQAAIASWLYAWVQSGPTLEPIGHA